MSYEEMERYLRQDNFHALTYKLDGEECGMAGWWISWSGDGDDDYREYETKEEMLEAELPTIKARFADITDIEIETE